MTQKKAIKLFFESNSRARKSLKYITAWNEKASLKENSLKLKMHKISANNFAYFYKLEYRRRSDPVSRVFLLRKQKFTMDQIGRILRISKQRVHQILGKKGIIA